MRILLPCVLSSDAIKIAYCLYKKKKLKLSDYCPIFPKKSIHLQNNDIILFDIKINTKLKIFIYPSFSDFFKDIIKEDINFHFLNNLQEDFWWGLDSEGIDTLQLLSNCFDYFERYRLHWLKQFEDIQLEKIQVKSYLVAINDNVLPESRYLKSELRKVDYMIYRFGDDFGIRKGFQSDGPSLVDFHKYIDAEHFAHKKGYFVNLKNTSIEEILKSLEKFLEV